MGTSATLIRTIPGTEVEAITVNYDGYPENMLQVLPHYTDWAQVEALFSLGCLSSIGNTWEDCDAYIRDRGEDLEDNLPRVFETKEHAKEFFGNTYTYFLNEEKPNPVWEVL